MWTLFKKEWQENALYFAAAFIPVLLVLDYTAHVNYDWSFLGISSSLLEKSGIQSSYNVTLPILTAPWNALCIIAAVLLGLRQIYTEHLRRTWGLLVKLPMPREKIVYAKFLAGLTLLAAFFLPAGLLIVLRLSTPGVWPGPVYWTMFLPLLLHLLAGLVCYQIILLTALAPQRWFGTRLLILFAAAPALLLADRFQSNSVLRGLRYGMDSECWILSGISLFVVVIGLRALRSVARIREY
jgi:ABC-type transport system involved in multi-copper enzyme maturation permease subunit